MGITFFVHLFGFFLSFSSFFFPAGPRDSSSRLGSTQLHSARARFPPSEPLLPSLRLRFSSGSHRTRDERRRTKRKYTYRFSTSPINRFERLPVLSLSRPDSNDSRRSASHEINAHRKTLKRFLALGDENRQPNGAEPIRCDTRKGDSHGTRVGRVRIEKQSQSPIRR